MIVLPASFLSPLLALVVTPMAMRAAAGPPFDTDDPEPVDLHHWEVYIASMYSHTPGTVSGTLPQIEVNYGAAPNLQLHIIGPAAFNEVEGGPNTYGFGDTELGMKYRFIQENKKTPMVGIFPLLELPSGNANQGLGAGQTRVFLPVWIQKSFGNGWQTYGGGGYWINPGSGNHNYVFLGYQLQNQITKRLVVGAEVFHTTPQSTSIGQQSGFNVGAVYDFDEGHHFMFSVGRNFQGTTGLAAYVAFQWTFGPHEKSEK